ncbi:sugar ABC transporter permease [Thermoanaerobacter sp. CM-CNRG TB177]|uniref:carbohydrate ABC transporter permease n=1 Tax=Thermoanaerobacter TaxID=1754 RepID=UPI001BDEB23D|nr:sugar ABC transporter permease [Thermoanaerobacter sp. CM-CNRG TB177]
MKRKSFFVSLLYSPKVAPYLFVLPFVVTFLLFFLYPVVSAFIMSFQKIQPGQVEFVGLTNYKRLLNPHFYTAIWNNTRYTFWTLLILIPIPIILAVFLNSEKLIGRNFFRAALFMPILTSVVVAGIVFRLIFADPPISPANVLLATFGLPPKRWLADVNVAMFLLVLLATWRWTGVNIVYFLSGLQSIPKELYEAAEIDGAGPISKFLYITLPLLKPVIIYVLTISIYGGYAMFTETYVFWGTNSPKDAGLTIVAYLYREAFQKGDFGFGAAIGIVLAAIVLIINTIQLKYFGLFKKGEV